MRTLLVFIAVAALSVLASHQRLLQAGRFFNLAQLAASGMLFLVLGALVGPGGANLLTGADVTAAQPLVDLGLGVAGLLMGLNLEPQLLRVLPGRVFAAAATHSLLAFFSVALPIAAILVWLMGAPVTSAVGAAALLGGAASVSSSHLAVLWYRAGRLDRIRGLSITLVAMLDDLVGVAVLALALMLGADADLNRGIILVVLALVLGISCGALTAYLIHESGDGAELTAILLGAVALVSGAAAFLRVSPLIAGLACGATLALVGGRQVGRAYKALARTERPVYLALLFLIGAHVDFADWYAWALLPVFVAFRFLGKLLGGRWAVKASGGTLHLPTRVGYALVGQGGVSLCLLIDYLIRVDAPSRPAPLAHLVFDVGVAAAVVNEVLGARAFRLSLDPDSVPLFRLKAPEGGPA